MMASIRSVRSDPDPRLDPSGTRVYSYIQLEVFVKIDYHRDTLRINSVEIQSFLKRRY